MIWIIAQTLIGLLFVLIGIEMGNKPPKTKRQRRLYRGFFVMLALSSIAVACIQYHNDAAERIAFQNAVRNEMAGLRQDYKNLVEEMKTNSSLSLDLRERIIKAQAKFDRINFSNDNPSIWVQQLKDLRAERRNLARINQEREDADYRKLLLSEYEMAIPCYNYAINSLIAALSKIAAHYGDKASSNFQNLPISPSTGDQNIGEVRFEKYTNWNFQIILQQPHGLGDGRRYLTFRSGNDYIEMAPSPNGSQFGVYIHLYDQEAISSDDPFANYKETIDQSLKLMLGGKIEAMEAANKP